MDETGLWLDMPGRTTLNERGARTVAIKTTGHEKDRFTVVLAARADGSKMHPMVIFRGKRKDKSLQKLTGVVIEMQENAWMTEELKENSHDFQVRVRYKSLAHKALSKRFYIFTWLLYCRSSAERKRRVEVGAVDDATGSYTQSMRSHSMR